MPVGTVSYPVDAEGGVSGGLEVIQPHKGLAHPNLSFLSAVKLTKDNDIKTHTDRQRERNTGLKVSKLEILI